MMKFISIPVYSSTDEETGVTHYDTDAMREKFEEEMQLLESTTQAELDGWADKQADYAMDNMTSDIYEQAREAFE